MVPLVESHLHPAVLRDPDAVRWRFRLRRPAPGLVAHPVVTTLAEERVWWAGPPMPLDGEWREVTPPVTDWPVGSYRLTLRTGLAGQVYPDGPTLVYHRQPHDPDALRLSPLAPQTLRIDRTRPTWRLADPPRTGILTPGLQGCYAVMAEGDGPCALRVGDEAWWRRLATPVLPDLGEVFVACGDLTDQTLEIAHDSDAPGGLRALRLVPVLPASRAAQVAADEHPPLTLRGIDDWWCGLPLRVRDAASLQVTELDRLIQGQAELGIRSLAWALGRSWVQYPSQLPATQLFPCAPISDEQHRQLPHHRLWAWMVGAFDTWRYPLARRAHHGVTILGWLAMNRHYAPQAHGGIFTARWVRQHPQFHHQDKLRGTVDSSRVEYFFPEVRRERLDIYLEAAADGPDGLVVGCCRQAPMLAYNETMVAAYRAETGDDPRDLDATDGVRFERWLRWRAGWFTLFLRDLRQATRALAARGGRPLPLAVRLPEGGLAWNLAEGFEVDTWLREGLVDELQLVPVDDGAARQDHDLTPYVALCRAHGVKLFGGVNASTGTVGIHGHYGPVAGLRRAVSLAEAGVAGLDLYEAETMATCNHERWLIPLWGDPARARHWLATSNLAAVFPPHPATALLGYDNHSFHYAFSLVGKRGQPPARGVTACL